MRKMKKFASLMLALVMVLALAAPAFASSGTNNDTGSITINNAIEGQSYSIYQLFVLESYNNTGDNENYAYKVTADWKPFVTNGGAGVPYVTVDEDDYVTWKEGANAADFAKLALAYAKEQVANADGAEGTHDRVSAVRTEKAAGTTVTFSNLNLGYYLVDSSTGALCSLSTTDPSTTIKEKNDKPSVDKEVKEDSTGIFGDSNTADIGQVVEYQTTITVQPGAVNYTLHDTMTEGLTFNEGSVVVTLRVNDTNVTDTAYTPVYTLSNPAADGHTFDVKFDNDYLKTLTDHYFGVPVNDTEYNPTTKVELVVSYTATLNENAVIASDANENETWLDYGDNPGSEGGTTPHDKTYTYTFDLDVVKTDNQGATLTGAEFQLYVQSHDETPVWKNGTPTENGTSIQTVTTDGTLMEFVLENGTYRVATAKDKDGKTEEELKDIIKTTIVVNADGKIDIKGLDAATYALVETKAPNGYNKLTAPHVFTIDGVKTDANGTTLENPLNAATRNDQDQTKWDECVQVVNKTGSLLPETGGIGTTIFYVVGGVLVAAAGVLLITKKRVNA